MAYNLSDILQDMLHRRLAAPGSFGVPMSTANNAAPLDPREARLRDVFTPYQPGEFVESKKTTKDWIAMALAGLADIRAAGPRAMGFQAPTDVLDKLRELRLSRDRETYETKEKGSRLDYEARQQRAMYELGQMNKEQERKDAAAMRAQEKADQLAFRAEDREDRQKFEAAQSEADKAFREAQSKADRDFRAYQEQRDRDLRLKLENIERSAVGDKVKEKQVEQQRDLLAGTRLKMATEAKAILRDNPDVNVDELRQDYLDEMKAVGMDPEYIESALAYFDDIAARYKKPEQPVSDGGGGIGAAIKNVIGGLSKGASMTSPSASKIAANRGR